MTRTSSAFSSGERYASGGREKQDASGVST